MRKSPEQVEFIRANFEHMSSRDLAHATGLSRRTVEDVRIANGLRKRAEHMRVACQAAAENRSRGIPPKPKGFRPEQVAWAEANPDTKEGRLILAHIHQPDGVAVGVAKQGVTA